MAKITQKQVNLIILTLDSKYSRGIVLSLTKYVRNVTVILSDSYIQNKGFFKSLAYIIKNNLYLYFS